MIIGLIPARSGSKGVPNKNIKKIGGKSLLEWSIQACKKSKHIDEIIISTDSIEYAEHAKKAGGKVPFIRPKDISLDTSTDYEFIKHTLDWLDANWHMPELIAHIRPTSPFRDPNIMDEAIQSFKSSSKNTALRSVHPMAESAYKTFEINNYGSLMSVGSKETSLDDANNARQKFPKTYIANGYIDVISSEFVIKNNKIHGDNVKPFITKTCHEIDCLEDFEMLEFQLKKSPQIYTRLF